MIALGLPMGIHTGSGNLPEQGDESSLKPLY